MRLHRRILPKFPKSLFLLLSQWHHMEKVFAITMNSLLCMLVSSLIIYIFFWLLFCSYQCPNLWCSQQHVQVKMILPLTANRGEDLRQTYIFCYSQFELEFIFNGPFPFFINKSVNLWSAAFDIPDVALQCFLSILAL